MVTVSAEERLARLEGGYEHLATKADIESLRADFNSEMAKSREDFKSEMARTRENFNSEMAKTRENFNSEMAKTREDFNSELRSVRSDVNRRIDRLVWVVLGIGGGLLAAVAAALIRFTFA